jgi:hypothetical protein
MIRCALLLWAFVVVTAAAFAQTAVPYIAAQAQANFPQADFAEHSLELGDGGAKTGYGGELTGGVLFEYFDLYAGGQFAHFDAEGYVPVPWSRPATGYTVRGDWALRRLVGGVRVHSCTTEPGVLSAIAGAGLSIGKSAADGTGISAHDTLAASGTSKLSAGMFGEIGLSWGLGEYVDVLTLATFHRFQTKFETDFWSGTTPITWISLSLGVVYRLRAGN